ncbi:MAG: hypothetical protein AAFX99_30655, partial [Myxococcota bacterium]
MFLLVRVEAYKAEAALKGLMAIEGVGPLLEAAAATLNTEIEAGAETYDPNTRAALLTMALNQVWSGKPWPESHDWLLTMAIQARGNHSETLLGILATLPPERRAETLKPALTALHNVGRWGSGGCAMDYLGTHPSDAFIDAVLSKLAELPKEAYDNTQERFLAILKAFGGAATAPMVAAVTSKRKIPLRHLIYTALAELQDPSTIPALLQGAGDSMDNASNAALNGLKRFAWPALEGPLAQALNARKKDTRMGAAGLLLEIPVTEATQALAATRAAKEKVAGVKQLLEQVLEAPLAAEGADEDTEVDQSPLEGFRAALDAEWVTQTHDALEGYTKTLADNERYLYQDNEQEPFRDFLLGLPGEPLAVAVVAADWMKNTGGYFPFMGLEALLERVVDRPEAPWLALEAWFGVYTADDEQSLERLKALFGAERLTAPTRIWATTEENSVELLHRMMVTHLPEVIAPIWVGQLKDRSKYAREHAEQLLAEAAEATTPFVITFLKDRQATIRQRAADWLAKHGGSHAREGLAKALKREKNKKARKAIVVALAAVTPIDVILEGATADTDAALDAVLSSSPSAAEDAPAGVDAQALTDLLWASGIPLSAGAQRWLLVGLSHENQDHSNTNLWRIRLRLDATHAEAAAETLMANLGTSNEARARSSSGSPKVSIRSSEPSTAWA